MRVLFLALVILAAVSALNHWTPGVFLALMGLFVLAVARAARRGRWSGAAVGGAGDSGSGFWWVSDTSGSGWSGGDSGSCDSGSSGGGGDCGGGGGE